MIWYYNMSSVKIPSKKHFQHLVLSFNSDEASWELLYNWQNSRFASSSVGVVTLNGSPFLGCESCSCSPVEAICWRSSCAGFSFTSDSSTIKLAWCVNKYRHAGLQLQCKRLQLMKLRHLAIMWPKLAFVLDPYLLESCMDAWTVGQSWFNQALCGSDRELSQRQWTLSLLWYSNHFTHAI